MAIPILFWMLECQVCGSRRVVHDTFLERVPYEEKDMWTLPTGETIPDPDSGYGGRPLPERYACLKGCAGPMRALGSLPSLGAVTMWTYEPHAPRQLSAAERREWCSLLREAGLASSSTFDCWVSDWQVQGKRRFRQVSLFSLPTSAQVVTIIVHDEVAPSELKLIERYFESGPTFADFGVRRNTIDADLVLATLMEVSIGDTVIDLDVYAHGIVPELCVLGLEGV
jgi:hypothetical protein